MWRKSILMLAILAVVIPVSSAFGGGATAQMMESLSQAKASAAQSQGNGALILSSALCSLWQSYPQAEQRQALLSEAKSLAAEHPGNRGLIMSAAMGRCP